MKVFFTILTIFFSCGAFFCVNNVPTFAMETRVESNSERTNQEELISPGLAPKNAEYIDESQTTADTNEQIKNEHGEFVEPVVFDQSFNVVATIIFVLAILHTFVASFFTKLAHKYKEGSIFENLFHLLGEVEAVFLIWAGILVLLITATNNWSTAVHFVDGIDYTEAAFVFVIMAIASTKPVIDLADKLIRKIDRLLPLKGSSGFLATVLIIGPLLGSIITEPAAMTVSALILYRQFFRRNISDKAKYLILAVLFVNVSIGGVLTNFAAPPVVLVAAAWDLTIPYMLTNFGWKAFLAIVINAYLAAFLTKKEVYTNITLLKDSDERGKDSAEIKNTPLWVAIVHMLFLAFTVINAHYMKIFMAGFIFFLGFATVTNEFQEKLKLRQALLVAGFLAGLVTLGKLQSWWIQPVISSLDTIPLFFGTVFLTSFTDNAALTFLASQVPGLSEIKRFAVLAAATAGGGLTVIANAPNPAGYSILNPTFKNGVNAGKLFAYALIPTTVAIICYWLFV